MYTGNETMAWAHLFCQLWIMIPSGEASLGLPPQGEGPSVKAPLTCSFTDSELVNTEECLAYPNSERTKESVDPQVGYGPNSHPACMQ